MEDDNNIIDPSEVFLGEDGNPIDSATMLGDLNNNDGGEPAGGNSNPDNGGNPNPPNPNGDNPNGDNGDNGNGDDQDSLENYSNPAEYAFKWLGYDTDEVDFGEGPVKLADLTSEQQTDVLLNQLQNVVESYEGEIANLRTGTPQLEDPFQKQVFE